MRSNMSLSVGVRGRTRERRRGTSVHPRTQQYEAEVRVARSAVLKVQVDWHIDCDYAVGGPL